MTSKASVPSTVNQRFVNRDLPFRQPLATVFSTVAADQSTVKATVALRDPVLLHCRESAR